MWLPRGCSSLGWRFSPRWGDVSVGEELCSPRMERSLGEGDFPAGKDFGQGGGFPGGGFWELRRKMKGRAGKKWLWSDGEGRYARGAGSG
ncbi:unnamed protein product [Sphagnum balticum]